jgi:hypothetical protein
MELLQKQKLVLFLTNYLGFKETHTSDNLRPKKQLAVRTTILPFRVCIIMKLSEKRFFQPDGLPLKEVG